MISNFYHETIRKYVIIFGNMFDTIYVQRKDSSGNIVQTLRVPIRYGSMKSFLLMLREDPDKTREVGISWPRLSFEITGINLNTDRQLIASKKNVHKLATDGTRLKKQFVPVPYDFTFNLYVAAKQTDDAAQIVEQIIPYFRPEWTVPIHAIPSMQLRDNIPITLKSVDMSDPYEGVIDQDNPIIWTLTFSLQGALYGPTDTQGIIKRAQVDIYAPETNASLANGQVGEYARMGRVVSTPGLLANGSPTSNSAASIDYNLIQPDDDYGFATDYFNFVEGLRYNLKVGQDG